MVSLMQGLVLACDSLTSVVSIAKDSASVVVNGGSPMRLSDELRQLADPIWQAQHDHPFVRGIGDGTLDENRFSFWLRQDYLFLIEYSRVLAICAARVRDLEAMTRFAQLALETLSTEMDIHRSYAAEFGVSVADLEREPMAPTTRAYTDFLVRTAEREDFADVIAAILPCMWAYYEIPHELAQDGLPSHERYARWIQSYATSDVEDQARWCQNLMDQYGSKLSDTKSRIIQTYVTGCYYELAFWDLGWNMQRWPLELST